MSYLGIVVTSVFASNALLTYGLGSVPEEGSPARRGQLASALAFAIVNAFAAAFLWGIHSFVLFPLGLGSLDILFFALLAVPLLKFVSRAATLSSARFLSSLGEKGEDLVVGSLVFGVALISANSGFSLPQALAASAASGLGFWAASALLKSIRDRLELSDLPRSFKGAPAMLLSAGLMSLAFMGIDAAFVKGLAG